MSRACTARAMTCATSPRSGARRLERERRDAAEPVAARALLCDDRRDVAREARRCRRGCLSSRRRERGERERRVTRRAAATTAIRTALRMLGVICTPELAEGAADLADRAPRREAPRASAGGGSRRASAVRRDLVERPRRLRASRSARTRAVRSRWRRSLSGSTCRSSTRSSSSSVKRFTPTTTRSPDSTSDW